MASKSINLLNAVKDLLIEFANKEGIILANEFDSVEDFKRFIIAFTVKSLVDLGMTVQDAYDAAMGDGAYDELVEKVWNECQ